MRVRRVWIQRGIILGMVCGGVVSCSSTASDRAMVSTGDASSIDGDASPCEEKADVSSGGAFDSDIDLGSLPEVCDPPPQVDASVSEVLPPCSPLAAYCPQHPDCPGPLSAIAGCGCVETWPAAVAYVCANVPFAGRHLNCNGFNVISIGSVEFSHVLIYDSATLALVGIAGGEVYMDQLRPGPHRYLCQSGENPELDPTTCESVTSGPCQ